jgi:hypothetical protein
MTDPTPELFAIVPIPPAGTARDDLLRHAIITGSLDEVMEYIPQSLSRQEALDIRAGIGHALGYVQHVQDYERNLRDIAAEQRTILQGVRDSAQDSFEKQRALSAKRAEAARKAESQRRVQQYLDALPDPDDPSQYPAPPLTPDPRAGDEDPTGIIPTPQDPTGASLEDTDPLPFGANPNEPHTPGPENPRHPQVAQPVSISLNEE